MSRPLTSGKFRERNSVKEWGIERSGRISDCEYPLVLGRERRIFQKSIEEATFFKLDTNSFPVDDGEMLVLGVRPDWTSGWSQRLSLSSINFTYATGHEDLTLLPINWWTTRIDTPTRLRSHTCHTVLWPYSLCLETPSSLLLFFGFQHTWQYLTWLSKN